MSLYIKKITNLSDDLKRIIEGECNYILKQYDKLSGEKHELIHEIRKSFKKIRAVLRLFRDNIDFYHNKNRFFRDEGRRISDLRDAAALVEVLDLIYEQYKDRLYKNAFKDLRNELLRKRDRLFAEVVKENEQLKIIYKNLKAEKENIKDWPLTLNGFDDIRPGLERVYQRGKEAIEKAATTRDPDDFHEWRKRVKYLRYQIRVLNVIWEGFLEAWENELHILSDLLGTDRDLYMLLSYLEEEKDASDNGEDHYLVRSLIEAHRIQLQEHAILLGKKLYHLKKEEFISLLAASWDAYEKARKKDLIPPKYLEF